MVTIDGEFVSKVEDLSQGNDENVRMFGIAKKKPHYNTYLSLERVVSNINLVCMMILLIAAYSIGELDKVRHPWDHIPREKYFCYRTLTNTA